MNSIIIYTTCATADEAQKIASHLLDQNLIACANIFAEHRALYRWEGKTHNEPETAMIMKTKDNLFDAVKDEICKLHSYDCPCIVAWSIEKGHPPFMTWINEETRQGI